MAVLKCITEKFGEKCYVLLLGFGFSMVSSFQLVLRFLSVFRGSGSSPLFSAPFFLEYSLLVINTCVRHLA